MTKRNLAALLLASAVSAVTQADNTAVSECFLTGKQQYASFGIHQQMDELEAGFFHDGKTTGYWQLSQGISQFNISVAAATAATAAIGIQFPATYFEETWLDQPVIPAPALISSTTAYYSVASDQQIPVVSVLDETTQSDVFNGKAVFCNDSEFVVALTDPQLFADTEDSVNKYSVTGSGLLLKGRLKNTEENQYSEVLLTVSSMEELLESEEESSVVSLSLYEDYSKSDVVRSGVTLSRDVLGETGAAEILYQGSESKTVSVTGGRAAKIMFGNSMSFKYAAKEYLLSAASYYESVRESSQVYSRKLAESFARIDDDLINTVSESVRWGDGGVRSLEKSIKAGVKHAWHSVVDPVEGMFKAASYLQAARESSSDYIDKKLREFDAYSTRKWNAAVSPLWNDLNAAVSPLWNDLNAAVSPLWNGAKSRAEVYAASAHDHFNNVIYPFSVSVVEGVKVYTADSVDYYKEYPGFLKNASMAAVQAAPEVVKNYATSTAYGLGQLGALLYNEAFKPMGKFTLNQIAAYGEHVYEEAGNAFSAAADEVQNDTLSFMPANSPYETNSVYIQPEFFGSSALYRGCNLCFQGNGVP